MSARTVRRTVTEVKPAAEPGNRGLIRRAVFGTVALVALGAGLWYAYHAANAQPIRTVRIAGQTGPIPRAELERLAESLRGLPVEDASLVAVRDAARRISWVREATVRRHFPDTVEITLETHEVLARWNDHALVSPRGEVFAAEFAGRLPRFSGPEGSSVEMAREFPGLLKALEPLGSALTELKLSPRGAWQVMLDSGLVLELGRGDTVARINRFAMAWPQLANEDPPPRYADLRYPNGFALRRPDAPKTMPPAGPGAAAKKT